MKKNEYFSNCYKNIISNKIFHLTMSFLEFMLTLIINSNIFETKYNPKIIKVYKNKISFENFQMCFKILIDITPLSFKLLIIVIIFILIAIFCLIYNKYSFKQKYIYGCIIINLFEVFFFRCLFIIIVLFAFTIDNFICLIISLILTINLIILLT